MSVINKATITFVQNGEPITETVLNRALNQTIDRINAYPFGGSYSAGSGISISGGSIAVNNTVLRTTGNFSVSGAFTFGTVVTATGFNSTSDKRLKDAVVDFKIPDNVDSIKLKEWSWADCDAIPEQLRGKKDSGVLADDVERVFPECVSVREDGFKTVDYGKLAVHLFLSKGE